MYNKLSWFYDFFQTKVHIFSSFLEAKCNIRYTNKSMALEDPFHLSKYVQPWPKVKAQTQSVVLHAARENEIFALTRVN